MPRAPELAHIQELAEAAYALRHDDSAGARRYATLAVALAENLPAKGFDEADARAFAWANFGNALRVANDLRGAESALFRALKLLKEGTGCLELRAKILSFQGSLYENCRRWPAAAQALSECLELRELLGDQQGVAACLVQLATVIGNADEPAPAVRMLWRALPLIHDDLPLMHVALQNLAWFLVDAGDAAAAGEIILEQEAEGLTPTEPLLAVRSQWLRGRIASAIGDHRIAMAEFRCVLDHFLARDQNYDAALVALELALECAALNDLGGLEDVLYGVAASFAALGIRREATATSLLERVVRNLALATEILPRIITAMRQEPLTIRGAG